MLTKEEIDSNINKQWEVSDEFLKDTRYGLCRFIVDLCQSLKVSTEVTSIAMYITNYFFVKKCYFNYEKLSLACAATLLSSKKESGQNRLDDISKEYFQYNAKIIGNQTSFFNSEESQKIKDKIAIYEIALLKILQNNIQIDLPYDYIYIYSYILYPDNENDIITISSSVAHDSFFTYANHVHKNYVVAITCIIIAAKLLEIPTVFDKDYNGFTNLKKINRKGITVEEFENNLITFGAIPMDSPKFLEEFQLPKDDEYFNKLSIAQKMHPSMNMDELFDCINMIMEFYTDVKDKVKQLKIN